MIGSVKWLTCTTHIAAVVTTLTRHSYCCSEDPVTINLGKPYHHSIFRASLNVTADMPDASSTIPQVILLDAMSIAFMIAVGFEIGAQRQALTYIHK